MRNKYYVARLYGANRSVLRRFWEHEATIPYLLVLGLVLGLYVVIAYTPVPYWVVGGVGK